MADSFPVSDRHFGKCGRYRIGGGSTLARPGGSTITPGCGEPPEIYLGEYTCKSASLSVCSTAKGVSLDAIIGTESSSELRSWMAVYIDFFY
ncbi:MAG TPA: hypothetical protein DEP46_01205 [Blastocatellia bacterium]|nr:hypothetical protein [Blastocatellia bacterium]